MAMEWVDQRPLRVLRSDEWYPSDIVTISKMVVVGKPG